jgi:hypothetical protein
MVPSDTVDAVFTEADIELATCDPTPRDGAG